MYDADAQASVLRGQGEAETMKSLAVMQQNPDLATFNMQMDALEQFLKKKTTLVLDLSTSPLQWLKMDEPAKKHQMNPKIPTCRRPQARRPRKTPVPPGVERGAMSSSFVVVRVIMVALVILFVSSGVFTVGPQEAAIKLFLGKPDEHGLYGPGLHWAWPAPIDEVVKFKITSLDQC